MDENDCKIYLIIFWYNKLWNISFCIEILFHMYNTTNIHVSAHVCVPVHVRDLLSKPAISITQKREFLVVSFTRYIFRLFKRIKLFPR